MQGGDQVIEWSPGLPHRFTQVYHKVGNENSWLGPTSVFFNVYKTFSDKTYNSWVTAENEYSSHSGSDINKEISISKLSMNNKNEMLINIECLLII